VRGACGSAPQVSELFDVAAAPRNLSDGSAASTPLVPTLAGVKWVGTDYTDWFNLVQRWNGSRALLFAPEPKLASFSLGRGRGAVRCHAELPTPHATNCSGTMPARAPTRR
jgi:hypothetical protein